MAASSARPAPAETAACRDETKRVRPSDMIMLGFDGAIRQDATALVVCRVLDGHLVLPWWQDQVDRWSAEFGESLRIHASTWHPLEWWTNRPTTMVAALESFHDAVVGAESTHDGNETLGRHVLNARRLASRAGIQIRKEARDSARKIDLAMPAVLAYECRAEVVSHGVLADAEEA